MAKQRLKMYVWDGVLMDYTGGIVVAYAATAEDAIELFRNLEEMYCPEDHIDGIKIDGVEPVCYDVPKCVYCYGGS